MAEAAPSERTSVAAQCLSQYFEELRSRGPDINITEVLCQEMLLHLTAVRDVVLAIPSGHPVFAMDGLEDDWGNETATAVKHYLDMSRTWKQHEGDTVETAPLLRTMWLHPELSERQAALRAFTPTARKPSQFKDLMGSAAAFIRLIGWGVADAGGLDAASLSAASALTLQIYHNERSVEFRSEYPILDALGVVLTWCLRGSDRFMDPESFEKAKAILIKYPSTCVALIEFCEFEYPYKFPHAQRMIHGPQDVQSFERDNLESLRGWLPAQQSTITWAKSIDLSYRDTLTQLATALATQESVELPVNIAQEYVL